MGSLVESRYVSIRRRLDDLGYREAFSVDSLALVEHVFLDLLKTTENLQKYVQESRKFKQISEELQAGVQPFKEESLRLIKENSHLRLTLQRNQEKLDEKLQESKSRLRDLESENAELKLLISELVQRVKEQTVESLAKTRKMAQLQERNLQASIVIPEATKNNVLIQRQQMQIDELAPKLCPHCARIRNFARFGKTNDRDITALDYMKIADSRIEALTLQNRSLKSTQQDLMELLKSMKAGIDMREAELENLKLHMKTIGPSSGGGDQNIEDCVGKDAHLALKSAQLQLQLLQKRNLNLERKLQNNLLQGHDDFMLNRTRSVADRNFIAAALMNDIHGECMFLGNENISVEEKLKLLEAQLSHCCQEKAQLKALLADCHRKHLKPSTTPDRDDMPLKTTNPDIDNTEHPIKLPRAITDNKKRKTLSTNVIYVGKSQAHQDVRAGLKKSGSHKISSSKTNDSEAVNSRQGSKSNLNSEAKNKQLLAQLSKKEKKKRHSTKTKNNKDEEEEEAENEQESSEEEEEEQGEEFENLRVNQEIIERPFSLNAEYDVPPKSSSLSKYLDERKKNSGSRNIGKDFEGDKFHPQGIRIRSSGGELLRIKSAQPSSKTNLVKEGKIDEEEVEQTQEEDEQMSDSSSSYDSDGDQKLLSRAEGSKTSASKIRDSNTSLLNPTTKQSEPKIISRKPSTTTLTAATKSKQSRGTNQQQVTDPKPSITKASSSSKFQGSVRKESFDNVPVEKKLSSASIKSHLPLKRVASSNIQKLFRDEEQKNERQNDHGVDSTIGNNFVGPPFTLETEHGEPKNALLKSPPKSNVSNTRVSTSQRRSLSSDKKSDGKKESTHGKKSNKHPTEKMNDDEEEEEEEKEEEQNDFDSEFGSDSDVDADTNQEFSSSPPRSVKKLLSSTSMKVKPQKADGGKKKSSPTSPKTSEIFKPVKHTSKQKSLSTKTSLDKQHPSSTKSGADNYKQPSVDPTKSTEISPYDDLVAYSSEDENDEKNGGENSQDYNESEDFSDHPFPLNGENNGPPPTKKHSTLQGRQDRKAKDSSSSDSCKGKNSLSDVRQKKSHGGKGGNLQQQPIIELSGEGDEEEEEDSEEGGKDRQTGDDYNYLNESDNDHQFDKVDKEANEEKKKKKNSSDESLPFKSSTDLKRNNSNDSKASSSLQRPASSTNAFKSKGVKPSKLSRPESKDDIVQDGRDKEKSLPGKGYLPTSSSSTSQKQRLNQQNKNQTPTDYEQDFGNAERKKEREKTDKTPQTTVTRISSKDSRASLPLDRDSHPYGSRSSSVDQLSRQQSKTKSNDGQLDKRSSKEQQEPDHASDWNRPHRFSPTPSNINNVPIDSNLGEDQSYPPTVKYPGFFSNDDSKGAAPKKLSLKSQSQASTTRYSANVPRSTTVETDYPYPLAPGDSRARAGPSHGRQILRDEYGERPGYDTVTSDRRPFTDPYSSPHDDYGVPTRQDNDRRSSPSTSTQRPPSYSRPSMDAVADNAELHQRIRSLERIIDSMKMKASLVDASKSDLENEVLKLRRALAECQEHGQQLKSEVQKARIMLEQTEALLNDTQRKAAANYVPTQRENQELNQQVRQLMAREMILEREVSSLSATVKALDRDKDEMRVELDRKDEKLAKLQAENAKQIEQVSKIQLQLKNAELQLGHTGETSKDQEREMCILRRQIEMMKADLEQRIKERDAAQRELNRLSQTKSKADSDMRHMSVELDKKNKESDELRLQIQKYIEDVRRVEELLLRKEEEMEALVENYRLLSQEKGTLESQFHLLERESSVARNGAREVIDTNSLLSSKLTSQQNLIQSYEEEIANLSGQVATLENQLRTLRESEKMLQNDLQASRDLCVRLEGKLDALRLELANAESIKNRLQADNEELQSHLTLLECQVEAEQESKKKLEELLAKMRENEYQAQNATSSVSAERDVLSARLSTLNSRTEQLASEVERYRLRSTELQSELDKIKRQYENEKIEREAAISELKRIQAQLSTSSTGLLMTTSMGQSRTPSPSPYQPSSAFPTTGTVNFPPDPDISPVQISPYTQQHENVIPSPEQTDRSRRE